MDDLQKFLSDVSSVYWWLSVFIVGLILTIIGQFLYKIVEKGLSILFESQRNRLILKKSKEILEEEKLIIKLSNSQDRFHWYMLSSIFLVY